jgi:hypothetical protein
MIYAIFVIICLISSLVFIILNWDILIESSSFKIPTPPPISKKPINKKPKNK